MKVIGELLLVEDNPGDVRLIEEALREIACGTRLHVTRDGLQALDFLKRQGSFAESVTPDLILLDLNLPRMDGLALLAALNEDPRLAPIPTVVLTTSACDRDVQNAYELGARWFATKPVDFDTFIEVVKQILEQCWIAADARSTG